MRVLAFSKTTTKGLGLVSQWLTVVGEIAEGGGFDKLNYSISCNSSVYVRRCDRYPVTHPTQLANDHLHTLDDSPLFPGVFDGEHRFEIVETEDGVNFIQAEVFSGVLSGVILKMAHDATKQGFEEMNAALKKQCESV